MMKIIGFAFLLLALSACENKQTAEVESLVPPSAVKYVEGVHFRKLNTPIAIAGNNITVNEFFWYGCPHCENFEPIMNEWESKKSADVIIERLPAVWSELMKLHGKVYFMAKEFGKIKELHPSLFKAVMALQSERDSKVQIRQFAQLFAEHGVDLESFNKQLTSFKTKSQLENAIAYMEQAKINSTPSLMVNGKYVVINNSAKSAEELMSIVNYLIELERKPI